MRKTKKQKEIEALVQRLEHVRKVRDFQNRMLHPYEKVALYIQSILENDAIPVEEKLAYIVDDFSQVCSDGFVSDSACIHLGGRMF